MLNHEIQIFSKLLDVNWEIEKGDYPKIVKDSLICYYHKLKEELIESMGEKEYQEFNRLGKEMFAPKI